MSLFHRLMMVIMMARTLSSSAMLRGTLLVLIAVSSLSSSVFGKRQRGRTTMAPTPQPPVGIDHLEPNDAAADAAAEDPHQPTPSVGLGFDSGSFGGLGFADPMKNKVKELNCSDRASCKKFHSPITSPNDLTYRNCYCDELCQTYDDCCRDYVRHAQSSVETMTLRPEVISCQPLSIGFKSTHGAVSSFVAAGTWRFVVVARCPDNYSEAYIRAKCELGSSEDADLFYRLPVNGRASRVLYANFYCAICNGDNTNIIYWTGERDACRPLPHNATIRDVIAANADCDIRFVYPDGYAPRLCKPVKRQCAADWTERKTAKKCQDRSQLNNHVYTHDAYDTMTFRNKHCAACNHLTEADTSCIDPKAQVHLSPPFDNRLSYSILFDLNAMTRTIRNNNNTKNELSDTEIVEHECVLGFVYDPYSEICRPTFCRKGYQLTDDGCEPLSENGDGNNARGSGGIFEGGRPSSNQSRTEDGGGGPLETVDLSCSTLIRLNASEYILLSNGSAYVHAMESVYNEDQYVLEQPYLYVCSIFNRQYNVTRLVMFQFDRVQTFLSFVGVIISLMSLLIQFVVYMIFPELRNTPGKCLICLIVSLFIGQLTFLFVALEGPACFYLAAAMHFGFLAAFFWMSALAFDIFRTFTATNVSSLSTSGSKWKRFLAYSIYAWLSPSLIVGLCVTMDILKLDESFRPHYGDGVCWITSQTSLLIFFAVPIGVILLVNILFFVITIYCICKAAHAAEMATPKTGQGSKGYLLVCIKLFFIMGLTWLFGFMASMTDWTFLWYVFIVLNSLQGAFLCLVFICTTKVYRLIRTKWSTKKSTISTTTPQNNQKASTNETILSKDDVRVVAKETCM